MQLGGAWTHDFGRHRGSEPPGREAFRLDHEPIFAARDDTGLAFSHSFESDASHFFRGFLGSKRLVWPASDGPEFRGRRIGAEGADVYPEGPQFFGNAL